MYSVDENYFEKINSNTKAYLLGFLAADGHLDIKSNRLHLQVKNIDEDIVKYLKEELKFDGPLYHVGNSIKLSVQRKKISEDLQKYNFTNRKSYDYKFPKIEEQFKNSFILGLFDGDGCVKIEKVGKSSKRIIVDILCTEHVAKEICKTFLKENITCKYYDTPSINTKKIRFSAKESVHNFYKYVYNGNEFSLNRKRNKFKQFFK